MNSAYRILIVDDDSSILLLLGKMLEREGYKSVAAENALDALSILEEQPIDLVLTDIHMPKINGLQFLQKVRYLKPHIPVIIMTADPNLPIVKQALKEGALDFLEKPFDLDLIFQTILRYASKRITGRIVNLAEHSLLLLAATEKKQTQLQRALSATRGTVTVVHDIDSALEATQGKEFDLVVYAIGENKPEISFFSRIQECSPGIKTICVADKYDEAQLTQLVETPQADSIVFKNEAFSEAEFLVVVRKLLSKDIFGMEKYLSWGFDPIQHITRHTDDRFKFIESMSGYLKLLNISPRFISRMENIADEFLSNALYNAPVDDHGEPLYRDWQRTQGRACSEREKCILSYAYDGRYFGISIQDQYGTITKEQIFHGLQRCLQEQGAPSQKAGGAGLGLYLSFLTLNKFIINLQPGRKTEMIGLCDVRSSMKDFDLIDKSLSIFVES